MRKILSLLLGVLLAAGLFPSVQALALPVNDAVNRMKEHDG